MAGIDITTILDSIPKDRKVKGLQKLGQILIQKGTELKIVVISIPAIRVFYLLVI